ncbi:MAG: YebC/PmpR family DNA-binding transcriptional regulator [Rhabdochlamydiaceae bacterium]
MAGHSKWANIKHRKEKSDKAKGKIFSRISKEIISAVKQAGPDPKSNTRLRLVIQKAKAANVPSDNIERNIKKASSADQADYAELMYELYGYGGVGLLVEIMTDNKNRTSSDMRIATNKRGGTIATQGAVSFNFDKKGVIRLSKTSLKEEDLFLIAMEGGAEDFEAVEDGYIITTAPESLFQMKEKLDEAHIQSDSFELQMIPKSYVDCSEEDLQANMALIDWLEDLDDVDAVYHNIKISE